MAGTGKRLEELACTFDLSLDTDHVTVDGQVRDTRTGEGYSSGQEDDPQRPYDLGYLGRLPRLDGNRPILAIAGIHPEGSLGIVHLLTTDIGSLWGQVGGERFSLVVGTEYDPVSHEPVRT